MLITPGGLLAAVPVIAHEWFNDCDWGGYLIWRLRPKTKVFIDGRSDVYIGDGQFRQYLEVG